MRPSVSYGYAQVLKNTMTHMLLTLEQSQSNIHVLRAESVLWTNQF
jgi:hypothetical protein